MMMNVSSLASLSDHHVLSRLRCAANEERHATVRLLALLAEVDTRRLYLGEGFSSLFTYCTQVLHFAEHAAYNRIEAARAARRFPIILDLLADGAVTLAAIRLLAPHLTPENHGDVLDRARHKSKREVEMLVATLSPRADVPSAVRKLPTPEMHTMPMPIPRIETPDVQPLVEAPARMPAQQPPQIKPLAPERYKIQFTVSRETYDQLRRAQDLLRHSVPNGDPAVIFERALALLVTELERSRAGKTVHPRNARRTKTDSRHIPSAVKRMVWQRDNGRCAFRGVQGRCSETGFLEYHHVVPVADGGETSAQNLELRCRAHNQYEAQLWFDVAEHSFARESQALYCR